MMSSVWRFIRRHRRKFLVAGVVTAAAAAAWHFLLPRARSSTPLTAEFMQFARQHQHLEATLRNCDLTTVSLLPRLLPRLETLTGTEALLAELRTTASGDRVALWEKLKVRVPTKALVGVYSTCLLTAVVHVQLSILGGYLFLASVQCRSGNIDENNPLLLSDDVKMAYLGCWRQILETDVGALATKLDAITQRVFSAIALQEAVSLRRLDALFHEIRLGFERELDATVRVRVACDDVAELSISDQAVLSRLVQETQELIDCPDFLGVYKACLDSAFSSLLDMLAEQFRRAGSAKAESGCASIYDVRLPFAKVVPLVNKVTTGLCSGDLMGQFNHDLLTTDVLKSFSRNIYETFSGRESK